MSIPIREWSSEAIVSITESMEIGFIRIVECLRPELTRHRRIFENNDRYMISCREGLWVSLGSVCQSLVEFRVSESMNDALI